MRIFLTLFATVLLTSCMGLQNAIDASKPTASISDVKIKDISLQDVTLDVGLAIRNPNPISLKTGALDLGLSIENQQLVDVSESEGVQLSANGTSAQRLSVKLPYESVFKVAPALKGKDEFQYQLAGAISIPVASLGAVTVPLSYQGTLPVVKLPKVAIERVALKDTGLTSATVEVDVAFANPNVFDLLLQNNQLALSLNNVVVMSSMPDALTLNQKGTSTLTLPVTLNYLNLSRSVVTAVLNQEPMPWKLVSNTDVSSPSLGLNLPGQSLTTNEWLNLKK